MAWFTCCGEGPHVSMIGTVIHVFAELYLIIGIIIFLAMESWKHFNEAMDLLSKVWTDSFWRQRTGKYPALIESVILFFFLVIHLWKKFINIWYGKKERYRSYQTIFPFGMPDSFCFKSLWPWMLLKKLLVFYLILLKL